MTKDNENNKVIIIGGGLAGLTLANSLKSQSIPFEVYERDVGVDNRIQGWSLNLNMAVDALKKTMPEESFKDFSKKACVVPGSESLSFKFVDGKTAEPLFSLNYSNNEHFTTYRLNRLRFRQWLVDTVQDHVHWNKKLVRYEENEDSVTAFFDDGTQTTGAILVGTDGVHSPVACQLLGGKERFDELTNVLDEISVYGASRMVSKELWNEVSGNKPQYFAILFGKLDEDENDPIKDYSSMGMFLSIQDYDENQPEVKVHWSLSRYDSKGVVPKFGDNESDNKKCLEMLKSWARRGLAKNSFYRNLVVDTPEDTKLTHILIRERIPTFELLLAPKRKVILVGDAAHPMSMYKGEGGNHAIIDAANLGKEIGSYYSGSKTLDEVMESYYKEMIPRSKNAVEESHEAALTMHTQPVEDIKRMYIKLIADKKQNVSKEREKEGQEA